MVMYNRVPKCYREEDSVMERLCASEHSLHQQYLTAIDNGDKRQTARYESQLNELSDKIERRIKRRLDKYR